jgi:hypothetical protein
MCVKHYIIDQNIRALSKKINLQYVQGVTFYIDFTCYLEFFECFTLELEEEIGHDDGYENAFLFHVSHPHDVFCFGVGEEMIHF